MRWKRRQNLPELSIIFDFCSTFSNGHKRLCYLASLISSKLPCLTLQLSLHLRRAENFYSSCLSFKGILQNLAGSFGGYVTGCAGWSCKKNELIIDILWQEQKNLEGKKFCDKSKKSFYRKFMLWRNFRLSPQSETFDEAFGDSGDHRNNSRSKPWPCDIFYFKNDAWRR